jgi:hypothetical protein
MLTKPERPDPIAEEDDTFQWLLFVFILGFAAGVGISLIAEYL